MTKHAEPIEVERSRRLTAPHACDRVEMLTMISPETTMQELWVAITRSLKDMAYDSVRQGKPYGLRGYPDFHREQYPGSFAPNRWEEPYFAGLKERLRDKGFGVETETRYPSYSGRCDLVVNSPTRKKVWLEVKTAFVECLAKSASGSNYMYDYEGDRLFEPQGEGSWRAGVRDLGDKDIRKLSTLTDDDAHYVGLLLIGFDRKSFPLDESVLYDLLPVEKLNWHKCHSARDGETWEDYYRPRAAKGFRDRVWLWYRPVAIARESANTEAAAVEAPRTISPERNEALNKIKWFCRKPYAEQGHRAKSGPRQGLYPHDWADLVQAVCKVLRGCDFPDAEFHAREIANQLRDVFPNTSKWNQQVNAPGAHEKILEIIERDLPPASNS